jgi:glycosyltransferase involved in cell wall biosynthesis
MIPVAPRDDPAAAATAPLLLHVFPTFEVGGVQLRMSGIIGALGGRYRHAIVAMDGRTGCRARLDAGIGIAFPQTGLRPGDTLGNLRRIRGLLAGRRCDLLLTYNWGAVEWALVNTLGGYAPHIHLESGFGPEEADGLLWRRSLFRRIALRRAHRVVVPSFGLVELARRAWKVPAARIVHIPNGVETARFAAPAEPALVPALAGLGGPVVGTVAPLRREKNIARLIEAFAALPPPAALVIVGDGPERAALESRAAGLGVAGRTVFAGYIDRPEAVLGLFDVYALSSDTEQMPNTIIQAMAAGLPVASVDVGDVAAVVAPDNRRYVTARGDAAALSQSIAALIADPALRRALGEANRAHVRAHYSHERLVAAYAALFDAVLADRPPVAARREAAA